MELKEIVVEDIKKEIIAFANCEGGKLYIGVKDDGTVSGLDDPDGETIYKKISGDENTGRTIEEIERDTDRDSFMSADEALLFRIYKDLSVFSMSLLAKSVTLLIGSSIPLSMRDTIFGK
ncbi:MAG: putative DNA binding domain-containing protein [Lachnospiraceae bacterium]|nr:putative DNA binding domain-containing protein [Lachnospiraceae bacterium]